MEFKNKSKEEILQWYLDNVPVGSIITSGGITDITIGKPYLNDEWVCVPGSEHTSILYYCERNTEGYKLKEEPKAGFNDIATIQNDKEARDAELKEKAFEIYKYCTLDETDESLMDEHAAYAYRVAETFLNYTHKNDSK